MSFDTNKWSIFDTNWSPILKKCWKVYENQLTIVKIRWKTSKFEWKTIENWWKNWQKFVQNAENRSKITKKCWKFGENWLKIEKKYAEKMSKNWQKSLSRWKSLKVVKIWVKNHQLGKKII